MFSSNNVSSKEHLRRGQRELEKVLGKKTQGWNISTYDLLSVSEETERVKQAKENNKKYKKIIVLNFITSLTIVSFLLTTLNLWLLLPLSISIYYMTLTEDETFRQDAALKRNINALRSQGHWG